MKLENLSKKFTDFRRDACTDKCFSFQELVVYYLV